MHCLFTLYHHILPLLLCQPSAFFADYTVSVSHMYSSWPIGIVAVEEGVEEENLFKTHQVSTQTGAYSRIIHVTLLHFPLHPPQYLSWDLALDELVVSATRASQTAAEDSREYPRRKTNTFSDVVRNSGREGGCYHSLNINDFEFIFPGFRVQVEHETFRRINLAGVGGAEFAEGQNCCCERHGVVIVPVGVVHGKGRKSRAAEDIVVVVVVVHGTGVGVLLGRGGRVQ